MDPRGSVIRGCRGVPPDPLTESLEFALPDVREPLPLGSGGRPGVEIDRDLELRCRTLGEPAREPDAVLQRRVPDGNERDDVGRAHARVLSLVLREIDPLQGDPHGSERRLEGSLGRRHECEHRPVVRGVGLDVEELHIGYAREGGPERVESLLIPALGKVGNACDERGGHGEPNAECGMGNAECKWKLEARSDAHPEIPHSAFRIPHFRDSAFRIPHSPFL